MQNYVLQYIIGIADTYSASSYIYNIRKYYLNEKKNINLYNMGI